jgi:hypothetical protein
MDLSRILPGTILGTVVEQAPIVTQADGGSITVDAATGKPVGSGGAGGGPPAPVTTPRDVDAEPKPSWLDSRLERERKSVRESVLKELGIDSIDAAKQAIAEARAKAEAEKSAEEKRIEAERNLAEARKREEALLRSVTAHAEAEMKKLSEAQQAAVKAVAGDDPAKQLETIAALAPTWAVNVSAPARVPDTAPAPNAPAPSSTPTINHRATYLELKKTNPILAARYAANHPEAYEDERS